MRDNLYLKQAVFVLPHHEHVQDLMSDLEIFMHNENIFVPPLIRIAIIHYQFETIHPFLDGNGRLGRLLIVLYLVNFKLLEKPALYLSDFFERFKGDYYDHLMAVRTTNNMLAWLKFFLMGVQDTAQSSIQAFKNILVLKENIEREKLPTLPVRRQPNVQALMRYLYQHPVVEVKEVATLLDVQPNTVNRLVSDFVNLGILQEITGQRRNRLYMFSDYVKLFMDDKGRIGK